MKRPQRKTNIRVVFPGRVNRKLIINRMVSALQFNGYMQLAHEWMNTARQITDTKTLLEIAKTFAMVEKR